jgi:hypothetical protein
MLALKADGRSCRPQALQNMFALKATAFEAAHKHCKYVRFEGDGLPVRPQALQNMFALKGTSFHAVRKHCKICLL